MEKDWVQIASFDQRTFAELKKMILEAAEIPVVTIDRFDSTYLFGEVELYVNREDVIRPKRILDEETT